MLSALNLPLSRLTRREKNGERIGKDIFRLVVILRKITFWFRQGKRVGLAARMVSRSIVTWIRDDFGMVG